MWELGLGPLSLRSTGQAKLKKFLKGGGRFRAASPTERDILPIEMMALYGKGRG
jgi:hypothetical protein